MYRVLAVVTVALGALGPVAPAAVGAGPRPERRSAAPAPGAPTARQARRVYRWHRRRGGYEPLSARIAPPAGVVRVPARLGSYAYWLRHLPLLPAATPVRSHAGRVVLPGRSPHLAAVVDLDVGRRDLQQCADTVMRLRGEYLYARGAADRARFRWAGGTWFGYRDFRQGLRPVKRSGRWTLARRAPARRGYRAFRRYLTFMFVWTGTLHQVGERRVAPERVRPGDFFVQAGSPGHAVVILDLARGADGQLRALLGQGFMPAQDLHVLRAADGSPWFPLRPGVGTIQTPLWRPFRWTDLRRHR